MSSRILNAWRHVVTVVVALHVVAITLMALPSPGGGLDRRDWDQPTVRGEFDAWSERLRAVGVDLTTEQLQDRAYGFARTYADGHQTVLYPFVPYYRYVGTRQSWRMFVAPHRFPSRLKIRIEDDGQWRTVYQARSPDHRWLSEVLDHDRFRAALFRYGWGNKLPNSYAGLVRWIADRAAHDFPNAERVQVGFETFGTLPPERVRAGDLPEVRAHRTRVLPLDARR